MSRRHLFSLFKQIYVSNNCKIKFPAISVALSSVYFKGKLIKLKQSFVINYIRNSIGILSIRDIRGISTYLGKIGSEPRSTKEFKGLS